jgi:hypothetical protein
LTYLKNPEVFRVQEGMVEALEGDGLGVEIDEARVRLMHGAIRSCADPTAAFANGSRWVGLLYPSGQSSMAQSETYAT